MSCLYRGRVVDLTGRPFAGSGCTWPCVARREHHFPRRWRRRAVTAGSGSRSGAGRIRPDETREPWRYTSVIAVAEGFGLGLSDDG